MGGPLAFTFPIFYAICMRNHRIIIGNGAEASVTGVIGEELMVGTVGVYRPSICRPVHHARPAPTSA